jgi:SAM-dependent methyltransferase
LRKTLRRHGGSEEYWRDRWNSIPADTGELNFDNYPGKFAQQAISSRETRILEAGCGAGRIFIHYHNLGYDIVGIDYIELAIDKIRSRLPKARVFKASITNLQFSDESFDVVLAFGLYHSLESGIDDALVETARVLSEGGLLVASMRLDNIQNLLTDNIEEKRQSNAATLNFHKWNYTPAEFERVLNLAGFEVMDVHYVENMPFLYKYRFFRAKSHKTFDEQRSRAKGYHLSPIGQMLQTLAMKLFPQQFANIMVAFASKKNKN